MYRSQFMTTEREGRSDWGKEPGTDTNDVVEVALLLSRSQAASLEATARRQGLTPAQMLRRLIRNFTSIDDG
jgi:hypothetical protein